MRSGAKYVLRGVRDGMSQEQIEKSYHNRFDADRVKNVTIDGSPSKGPESAPITLVEFADFECPFCAMEAPVLEKAWQGHQTSVRFVYKYFVISAHPHGESAARAAIAAGNQGKFWEMHDMLFANRDHLEGADVDAYAKSLGLDVAKLHADMQSQATTDRIAQDKKLGESLGVQGTPTIFLNGREYDPHQDIDDWMSLELQSLGVAGTTAGPAAARLPAGAAAAASKERPSRPRRRNEGGRLRRLRLLSHREALPGDRAPPSRGHPRARRGVCAGHALARHSHRTHRRGDHGARRVGRPGGGDRDRHRPAGGRDGALQLALEPWHPDPGRGHRHPRDQGRGR